MRTEAGFGATALLRVAGVPMTWWLAGANPDLFALLRRLDRAEDRYRRLAARAADRIGQELVPSPALTAGERATALAVRRSLHNGGQVSTGECLKLVRCASTPPTGSIATDVARLRILSVRLEGLRERAAAAVADEEQRLYSIAWELVHTSPVAAAAVRLANPETYRDIQLRVDRGDSWSGKRMRQRADYLWRMITRATTKTTPRGWFAHVALVDTAPGGADMAALSQGFPLTPYDVGDGVTLHCLENLHLARPDLAGPAGAGSDPRVALAPLLLDDGDLVRVWAIDPTEPDEITELTVRRTALLAALRRMLPGAPQPLDEVAHGLLPGRPDAARTFLTRLVELGVLQVSRPLAEHFVRWSADAPAVSVRELERNGDGFVDAYRHAHGTLSGTAVAALAEAARQALRVYGLVHADAVAEQMPPMVGVPDEPRPVLDVVAEHLRDETAGTAHRHEHGDWREPAHPDSAYARLLAQLANRFTAGGPAEIPPSLLTEVGAPDAALAWPLDCMVRPLAPEEGALAVLESFGPAGVIDARFGDGADQVYGGLPAARAYRAFLDTLELRTGMRLVELLVPPLSRVAANAVRRPLYTGAWTGDPDLSTYCRAATSTAEYVPLRDITVRLVDGRIWAEVHGRRIWPMYHATRTVPAAWRAVTRLLRRASPYPLPPLPHRSSILAAFPDRAATPRISIGGLVIACAQWRVGAADLWDPAESMLAKVRAMDRLRARAGLPRWVMVRQRNGRQAYPCDLESVRSVRLLERTAASASAFVLEEMLPAPDRLLVADPVHPGAGRLAAQLVLRLPVHESPPAMARRIAVAVTGDIRTPVPV
jgi:hypothetical protein